MEKTLQRRSRSVWEVYEYPIVVWARKHGMNTAEMTVSDMYKFMKWWMKQKPITDDLLRRRSH